MAPRSNQVLDFSSAAKNYLHKSLLKFKAVTESPDLPPAVTKPPAPMPNSGTANVIARLCNSNPVREALPAILKDVQQALGVKVPEEKLQGKKRLRVKDFEEAQKSAKDGKKVRVENDTDVSDHDSGSEAGLGAALQRRPHSDNEDDISDEEDGEGERQGVELGDDDYDSDDFAQFDSRIAASSGEEDHGYDTDGEPKKGTVSRAHTAAMDISTSVSPEPERRSKKMAKPTKSAFVPSLTMGGYWSGSESEPEDDDLDVAPRKNRRGQRARQLIAEKKFGKSAKHLQKEGAVSRNDRNQGWDPKRGATDGSGPRLRGRPSRPGKSAPTINGNEAGISKPPPKKHRDDSGSLHPSWEAAKKAKEAKATAPFAGKRVTFD